MESTPGTAVLLMQRIRRLTPPCRTSAWPPSPRPPHPADDFGYNYLLRGTELRAINANHRHEDVSQVNCRVVGWLEHAIAQGILAGLVPGEPQEAQALKALTLDNVHHVPLTIERHLSGFVIAKR